MRVGTHSTSGTEPNKESTCDNVKNKNACGREAPKVHATPKTMKTTHAATKQRQHLRQRINKHTCGNESRTVLAATKRIKIRTTCCSKKQKASAVPKTNKDNACGNYGAKGNTCGHEATKTHAATKHLGRGREEKGTDIIWLCSEMICFCWERNVFGWT